MRCAKLETYLFHKLAYSNILLSEYSPELLEADLML